jgi:NIMA (never in mitosis gene a)-related kinase
MIKMMNLCDKEKDSALNEIRLLASINSPNVVTYHTAFFDNTNATLCIVMEYADGGDLAVPYMLYREWLRGKAKNIKNSMRILFGK